MNTLFEYTYNILLWISEVTGFTYKEINIIVWFILIPLSWMILFDKIYKQKKCTIIFVGIMTASLLLIQDFTKCCNWLFQQSVDFLNLFNTLGSNYVVSSVLICVFVPIVIYVVLIRKAFFKKSEV